MPTMCSSTYENDGFRRFFFDPAFFQLLVIIYLIPNSIFFTSYSALHFHHMDMSFPHYTHRSDAQLGKWERGNSSENPKSIPGELHSSPWPRFRGIHYLVPSSIWLSHYMILTSFLFDTHKGSQNFGQGKLSGVERQKNITQT